MRRQKAKGKRQKVWTIRSLVFPFAFCLLPLALGAAAPTSKPVQLTKVVVEKADKTRLAGKITQFDASGFVLVNDRNETHEVQWSEMAAKNVFPLYARLIDKSNDAEQWI